MTRLQMDNVIYFSKIRETAIIPSKRSEDAGVDIYANFSEYELIIQPHTTVMIPTGIASSCSKKYCFILKERGSTGTKGIAQRCGVIDSGYKNEWFIPITNTTNKLLVITKDKEAVSNDLITYYPYDKAICQALLIEVPDVDVQELSYEQLCKIDSERGMGKLGDSGK